MRAALVAALVALAAPAQALAPPAVKATLSSVLILDTVDQTRGLCVAISTDRCATSYHVVRGHGFEYQLTDSQQNSFRGRLGWYDQSKDLAIIWADAAVFMSVRFAKRLPEETEDVWMWTIYPDRSIHLFEGRWAGARSGEGFTFHTVDGYTESGTSGSLIANANGEAVAILCAAANPAANTPLAQHFRPLVLVQPIIGGVK